MAIAINVETHQHANNASSQTDTSVIPSGSDLGMLALNIIFDATTDSSFTSSVFNTTETMTKAVEKLGDGSGNNRTQGCAIYALEAPTATDAAMVSTYNEAITRSSSQVKWFTGVHQTDMIGATASAETDNTDEVTVALTTTVADSYIVALAFHVSDAEFTPKSGLNEHVDDGNANYRMLTGSRAAATVQEYTLGWDIGSTDPDTTIIVAAEILPAAAGGAPPAFVAPVGMHRLTKGVMEGVGRGT